MKHVIIYPNICLEVGFMPRTARIKSPDLPYHIMCRSISEISLFKSDEDKIKYLQLMNRYCKKFQCSILAYCLMDNHLHIQFDPQGADISKFMHGLNLSYAQYYNRKYKRHGPVFQGRFISKLIDVDEYNLIVSAYIHNNPKNIPDYSDCVHSYQFSSYGIYLGHFKSQAEMLNTDFVLSQFSDNLETARIIYADFVINCNNVAQKQEQFELIDTYLSEEPYEYRSGRLFYPRDFEIKRVVDTVAEAFDIKNQDLLKIKYCHNLTDFKAVCIFLMRCLCDFTYKEICKELGNLTLSHVAKLSDRGFELLSNNPKCQDLLPRLLDECKAA